MTKICFSGIGGNGMNPLAQIMRLRGYEVVGTDRNFDTQAEGNQKIKEYLESIGIAIKPQNGSAITDDIETLYISTAINDSNPDVKAALAKDIPIKTRPDLLAEIFDEYKYNIAVGGTSGKTTTTAMIGYALDVMDKKPCMIGGGMLKNYEDKNPMPYMIYNKGDICVIEADESNGTIEQYNPYITTINNISVDHKPLEEIKQIFANVAKKPKHGLVLNADCPYCKELANNKIKTVWFSLKDKNADFHAYDIKNLPDGIEYKLAGKTFKLKQIGEFNVENALTAIAACSLLGIDKFETAKALEGFLGTKRRLELIGRKNDITVINDFAHNPEKVLASAKALKSYNGRLIIMFQIHGPDPAKLYGMQIMESFAQTLNKDDILLMPEIFYKTEADKLSAKEMVEYAKKLGLNAAFTETKDKAREIILKNAKAGDRIIAMGARDNSLEDFCKSILKEIK
ncbi:MAG: Mur ligase domain-containing protein [Lactobacillaceae bacterium]|jgi:UDP-N-acetylmuramate--alanine ligase|nr:Mur ligase domain-containing protein [Lactobacillaceae bacterium]